MELKIQPNEKRCRDMEESHILSIENCCPVSRNPQKGSKITITYSPVDSLLEVAALKVYIDSYIGGKGEIRSMEGMIQNIANECSQILQTPVVVKAQLFINPDQEMHLTCKHNY